MTAESQPSMRRTLGWLVWGALVWGGGAVGCAIDEIPDGLPAEEDVTCGSCHGSDDNPAPPRDLDEGVSTDRLGVGAHQVHLSSTRVAAAVACAECHLVPDVRDAEGHIDPRPAELTWGALATAHGGEPVWDRQTATCSNVYCHGVALQGGKHTEPTWTRVDGTQAACDSCHGAPPPAPHPSGRDCYACHPGTVLPSGAINAAGGLHVDGRVQIAGMACNSCHGSANSAAPPRSLAGATSTETLAVGAHQQHLTDGDLRVAVACSDCHVLPTDISDPNHGDDGPAEVVFSELAGAGRGLAPVWDRDSATCSNVVCHGAGLSGGNHTRPVWTQVDGTQVTCDGCHGWPPLLNHPDSPDCYDCHPDTVYPDGTINVASHTHIDGTVQSKGKACNACHGSVANAAPPWSVEGNSDTRYVGVGAHQVHVNGGDLRTAVGCDACHRVPETFFDGGHGDALPAEVVFGELASTAFDPTRPPTWDRTTATCSNVYCHGASLDGGEQTAPIWTRVDGTQSGCGSCHGAPPPSPHPSTLDCFLCHPDTVDQDNQIIVEAGHHMDGEVDLIDMVCNACHGSQDNAAPPGSVLGYIETSRVEVGAHQSHVAAGLLREPMVCADCHVVPAMVVEAAHIDGGAAELRFGSLATGDGLTPVWDRESATCSNVYCHGATLAGGRHTQPEWTRVDGVQMGCDSCHGAPPPPPHPMGAECWVCHPQTVTSDGALDLAGGAHINGRVDVKGLACNSCHGGTDSAAPPAAVRGEVSTDQVAVGAHQSHVRGGALRTGFDCDVCHLVPEAVGELTHADGGPAEVVFMGLSVQGGTAPQWDRTTGTCTNVYCHGSSISGGIHKTPRWTVLDGSQVDCNGCHGAPPPAPHPASPDCYVCHPSTVLPSGDINLVSGAHINGRVDSKGTACNACHGGVDNAAPPVAVDGRASTLARGVGAHQSHLRTGLLRAAMDCLDCHVVPQAVGDATHADGGAAEVTFGALASADGLTPQWDPSSETCSNVYCHGSTLSDGAHTVPVWTKVDGLQSTCESCHGFPPTVDHPSSRDCHACHPATVLANGAIDVAGGRHIDGTVQIAGTQCAGACHGTDDSAAPPKSVGGATSATDLAVGAHQAHLRDGALRQAIACSDCHIVPAGILDVNHGDDGPAEVVFSERAGAGRDPAPIWDRDTGTCRNIACHGAGLVGGIHSAPVWTQVDGSQVTCDGCHGFPPLVDHPNNSACYTCHPESVRSDGTIDVASGTHIDGVLQSKGTACNACHGSIDNDAPPHSVKGTTDTAYVEIGAHQAHVTDSELHAALACDACHIVPNEFGDAGHADGSPSEVVFGDQAKIELDADNPPAWNRDTGTCTNVYCHGASLSGGTHTSPVWTRVDGTQSACGSCHGNPPPPPLHPQARRCELCHSETVNEDGLINTGSGTHLDGVVQAGGGCEGCHDSAPDTGAHRAHFAIDPEHATYGGFATVAGETPSVFAVDCGNCHPHVQGRHMNGGLNPAGGAVELDFSPTGAPADSLKARNSDSTVYVPGDSLQTDDRGFTYTTGGTCDNVYCHVPRHVDFPDDSSLAAQPIAWDASGPLPCTDCHVLMGSGVAVASTHTPIAEGDEAVTQRCALCHVLEGHTGGQVRLRIGDDQVITIPTDGGSSAVNAACLQCHEGAGEPLGGAFPPVVAGYDSDTGDFHGVRMGTGWGGALLPPYERGQGPLPCVDCHAAHESGNPYLFSATVNGSDVPIATIDHTGFGAETLCERCHQGERHAQCYQACHYGRDPAPAGVACFFCHSHQGIVNFNFPNTHVDPEGAPGCSHCHDALSPSPEYRPPELLGSLTVSHVTHESARISWLTNESSNSTVEFGVEVLTEIARHSAYSRLHQISLSGLQPRTTYLFRVRSADRFRNEFVSDIYDLATASMSGPPAPVLRYLPNVHVYPADPLTPFANVTLSWMDLVIPNGDLVEYRVQVSEFVNFETLYGDSDWSSATAFVTMVEAGPAAVGEAGGKVYYWRVMARDAVNGGTSPWSNTGSFTAYAWDTEP